MQVGQKTLGHAHRQKRNAALFDEGADLIIGLRICRAFAQNNQRAPGTLQEIERTPDGGRSGNLGRCRVDHLDE
jgi:hypothetical protein